MERERCTRKGEEQERSTNDIESEKRADRRHIHCVLFGSAQQLKINNTNEDEEENMRRIEKSNRMKKKTNNMVCTNKTAHGEEKANYHF